MSRRVIAFTTAVIIPGLMLHLGACEDEIVPPPEEDKAATPALEPPPLDLAHRARFSADRTATFSNVVFIWRPDPLDPRSTAISLTTERAGADGSRLIFGAYTRAAAPESLRDDSVTFVGGARLDPRGSGIFTPIAVYQPRHARLKVTRVEKGEIEGSIKGEFYVFRATRAALRPETIEGELTFVARLIDRSRGGTTEP